jgi:hypothetical protein
LKRWLWWAVRGAATALGIIVTALAAVVVLTEAEPGRLLTDGAWLRALVPAWLVRRTPAPDRPRPTAESAGGPAATRWVPLYSDDWFDDSGFSFLAPFSPPVDDPSSLDQLRSALEGRSRLGLAMMQAALDRVPSGAPDAKVHVFRLNLIIGSLLMYEGRFGEAARSYEAVLKAEPTGSELVRANLEALIGVAELRRGETENCVACRNEASCIFPLAPEAVHRRPSGSRAAVRRFNAYLGKRPEDLGVRWLLNIAYMTLGEYPNGVPPRYLIPMEPFRSKLDIGRFVNVAPQVGLDARGPNMAGGCIADDFNGDGLIDVFFSTADPSMGAALFVNKGDGTFEDRSESAGLTRQVAALNAKQADFDNDGDLDVLLLRGGWELPRRPSLLRNKGGGVFEDVTIAAGLAAPIASQSGAWADYDNDGWLDLYIAGEYDPQRPDPRNRGTLYHNNRDGTFTDVSDRAGVRNLRFGKGADWGDYDNDGDPDLYISNLGQPNRLYRNNSDGTFTDVAPELGVTEPVHSFPVWFWDYDNDGWLDLFVGPYSGKLSEVVRSHLGEPTTGERPRLYHNEGPQGFRDVAREAGLDRVLIPMGSNFGDLDNDGYLDMYLGTGRPPYMYLVPNVMYKNVGGERFEDITTSSGTGHLQKGHGVAFADWDRDGDVDIFLESGGATPGDKAGNILFRNPGQGNHWLNVRLIGVTTNRSAIGARISVEAREPDGTVTTRHRVISSGGSFGGNPLAVTIGLGRATTAARLKVTWPTSRSEQTFYDLPPDRAVEVVEGRPGFRPLNWGSTQ